jgi:hypothetical protein
MRRLTIGAVVLALTGVAGVRAQAPAGAGHAADAGAGMTVVLLLDVSASMTTVPLAFDARYAQVFNAFVQGLAPADRAAVGLVSGGVRFSGVTADRRELSAAVRTLMLPSADARRGPSPLWDALDQALPLAAAGAGGRAAIVLFTDGKSAGNVKGLDDVIDRARQLGVRISAVVEGPGTALLARSRMTPDPAGPIERLTEATGGTTLLDRPVDPRQRNPGPMVSLLMDRLRR